MSIKVGDRIRDYSIKHKIRTGKVLAIINEMVEFISDESKTNVFSHIKCVRKLRKKKRREIWVGQYNDGKTRMAFFPTKEHVPVQLIDGSVLVRAIRFVESKEGK